MQRDKINEDRGNVMKDKSINGLIDVLRGEMTEAIKSGRSKVIGIRPVPENSRIKKMTQTENKMEDNNN